MRECSPINNGVGESLQHPFQRLSNISVQQGVAERERERVQVSNSLASEGLVFIGLVFIGRARGCGRAREDAVTTVVLLLAANK